MKTVIRKLLKSFACAGRGICDVLRSERNARIHAVATLAVCLLGLWARLRRWEWCVLILTISAVLSLELINTALEHLADAACPEEHPLIKRAKDAAAGGVLVAALASVIIGLILFLPRLVAQLP
jgi:diacylglycerol kinase